MYRQPEASPPLRRGLETKGGINKGKNFFVITKEEALVDYNMHFKRYGSFGVLVQQERNMNHDSYTGKRNLGRGIFGFLEVGSFDERLEN